MDLVDFKWWRCIDGYRLKQTKPALWTPRGRIEIDREERVSLGNEPVRLGLESASDRFEQYEPFKISGLFTIFAEDTPATPEGMQAFCNKFGLLGGGRPDLASVKGKPKNVSVVVDDLLALHREFRRAVDLYRHGDLAGVANYWNSTHWPASIRTGLRVEHGKIEMMFEPPGLIQAMWLQFAFKVCADTKLLRCERCGTPFAVGTGTGRRKTSKFCSNACKVAAFKRRRASQ